MSKQQPQAQPPQAQHYGAALPSYQELAWGDAGIGGSTWPDRVWAQTTAALPESGSQNAVEQARVSAVALASAGALSAPPTELVPRKELSTSRTAPLNSNEERVAQWFAHWQRVGAMGLVNLVPEPFRYRYPHLHRDPEQSQAGGGGGGGAAEAAALEEEADVAEELLVIKQCLLHFMAWNEKK